MRQYEFFTYLEHDCLLGRTWVTLMWTLGEMIAAYLAALAVVAVAGGEGIPAYIWPRSHSPPI